MIIYNPQNIIKERIKEAEEILNQIPSKYCFISGSFLHKKKYKDIDVFVVSRTKKKLQIDDKRVKITIIDFNDLYSLFYHSVFKSCIAKEILPVKELKVTVSDFWNVINEAIPTLLNQKDKFHKDVRFLVLYTEYFRTGEVLDTFLLDKRIRDFKDYKEVLKYVEDNVPKIINLKMKKSYLKRFFYTQAGHYKELRKYSAQNFLYELTHSITRGIYG